MSLASLKNAAAIAGTAFILATAAFAEDPPKVNVGGPQTELGFANAGSDAQGVVAVWPQGKVLAPDEVPEATLGDTVIVRVRNLDGWMVERLKRAPIAGQTKFSDEQRKLWLDAKHDAEAQGIGSLNRYVDDLRKRAQVDRAGIDAALKMVQTKLEEFDQRRKPPTIAPDASREVAEAYAADVKGWRDERRSLERDEAEVKARLATVAANERRADDIATAQRGFNALMAATKENLFLVLGNARLRAIQPRNPFVDKRVGAPEGDTDWDLEFRLVREPGDENEWKKLYAGAQFRNPVEVRLGLRFGEDETVLQSAVTPLASRPNQRFNYLLFRPWRFAIAALAVVVAFMSFISLAGKSDILRDADASLRPDGQRQFSLARSQMAFWFFLVIAAYLFLWVVTLRTDTLNGTALGLIGIGAATALGSTALTQIVQRGDAPAAQGAGELFSVTRVPVAAVAKDSETEFQARRAAGTGGLREQLKEWLAAATAAYREKSEQARQTLTEAVGRTGEEAEALKAEAARLKREASAAGEEAARLSYQIQYLNWPAFRQMLEDWLTDGERVTLHRFQMIVWTVVLGFIYLAKVVDSLEMPVFSDTLLALLGISSGTYLGFKVPEIQQQKRENQR